MPCFHDTKPQKGFRLGSRQIRLEFHKDYSGYKVSDQEEGVNRDQRHEQESCYGDPDEMSRPEYNIGRDRAHGAEDVKERRSFRRLLGLRLG